MSLEPNVLIPRHISPGELRGATSGLTLGSIEGEAMGTTWKLRFQQPRSIHPQEIREAVSGAFALVVSQMSHWDGDSELSRFNRSPEGTWQRISQEFFEVMERSLRIAKESGGNCDPTLGELVDMFGFGSAPPVDEFPTVEKVTAAQSRAGWQRLRLRQDSKEIFQPGGCRLDLSAIAKGYAVDLAAQALINLGMLDFVLELGGELRGHGCKPDGQPWWVSIDTPFDITPVVVALCGLSLATSGDTFRRRFLGNREINHLISPESGYPVEGELLSVSVFSKSCFDSDSWATALYIAGVEAGTKLADENNLAALFITRDAVGHGLRLSSEARLMIE